MLSAFIPDAPPPFFSDEEEKPTVLWELTKMQDVWSMDCDGVSVIVGGNQQIVYASNVINPLFRSIRTPGGSDALSVCQMNVVRPFPPALSGPMLTRGNIQNEALVGLRSSTILHYDFRLPDKSAITSRLDLGKSVCGIKVLDEGRAGGRSFVASGYTHQVGCGTSGDMEIGADDGSARVV